MRLTTRQMGVAQHHLVTCPAAQLHQCLQAGAGLYVAAGPGVSQVMPTKVGNPRKATRPLPAQVIHAVYRLTLVGEDVLGVLTLTTPHNRHGLVVQWYGEIALGLGLIGMDPACWRSRSICAHCSPSTLA